GGNGGGLVFIVANQITGTGSITSNGEQGGDTGTGADNDAAGGGGAGGTIVVVTNSIANTITLQANGGDGGDQFMPASDQEECEGPGGGGGGGYVALATVSGSPTRS